MDLTPTIEALKEKRAAYREEIKDLERVISSCTTKEEEKIKARYKNGDGSQEDYENYIEDMRRAGRKNKKAPQRDASRIRKNWFDNYAKDIGDTVLDLTKAQKVIDTHLKDP